MQNAKNAFGINPIPKENAKIVTFLLKDLTTVSANVLHLLRAMENRQESTVMQQVKFANALQHWPPVLEDNIATLLLIMEEVFANAHQTLNVMSVRYASMVNVNADRPIHVLES